MGKCYRCGKEDCVTICVSCANELVESAEDYTEEACQIIRALLGAPPPRTWEKWPVVYKRAREFLATHSEARGDVSSED